MSRRHYRPNRLFSNLLHVVGATAAELVSRSADVLVQEIERETPNLPQYFGIEGQVDALDALAEALED